jgi:hypothetical protein
MYPKRLLDSIAVPLPDKMPYSPMDVAIVKTAPISVAVVKAKVTGNVYIRYKKYR